MGNLKLDARALQQQIANLYLQFPELREDDEMLRVDMLEGATNLDELLTVIVRGVEDAKALRDGTKIRLDELEARQKRFKTRIEFLRGMALKILQAAELKKRELPEATLSIRQGPQQLIGDPDPATLPDDLCRVSRDLDRAKIKDKLLAGEDVEGFVLSNAEPSLSVRVK